MKIPRIDYKKQILSENYRYYEGELSFAEYVKAEQENDPDFFRWLFELYESDEYFEDFYCPDEYEFEEFLSTLNK